MSRIRVEHNDGGVEYAWFDDATGDLLSIEREDDVEPVLEHAKSCFNEGLVNTKCEFRRVGSYPLNVLRIFAQKWGIDPDRVLHELGKNHDLTMKLVNDRDLSGFRTLPGQY